MSSGSALKKPASPLLAFFLLQVAATAASSIARCVLPSKCEKRDVRAHQARPRTRRLTGVPAFTQPSLTHSSSCPGAVTAFHPSLHHEQPRFRLGLIKQQHQWRRPASSSFSSSTQQQLVGTPTATTAVDNDTKQQQPQSLAFVERIMAPRGGASNGNGNGNGKGKDASLWNLPNILTLMRVFAIPVLVAIFYQDVVRLPSKMNRLLENPSRAHVTHQRTYTQHTPGLAQPGVHGLVRLRGHDRLARRLPRPPFEPVLAFGGLLGPGGGQGDQRRGRWKGSL